MPVLRVNGGRWVLGIEGTYNIADLKQTEQSNNFWPYRLRSNQTRDLATGVGKIGVPPRVSGWSMERGGFACCEDRNIMQTTMPATTLTQSVAEEATPLTLAVDYMFVKNWIVGADFNYYDFRFDRCLEGNLRHSCCV